jgi:hypothetical protein
MPFKLKWHDNLTESISISTVYAVLPILLYSEWEVYVGTLLDPGVYNYLCTYGL